MRASGDPMPGTRASSTGVSDSPLSERALELSGSQGAGGSICEHLPLTPAPEMARTSAGSSSRGRSLEWRSQDVGSPGVGAGPGARLKSPEAAGTLSQAAAGATATGAAAAGVEAQAQAALASALASSLPSAIGPSRSPSSGLLRRTSTGATPLTSSTPGTPSGPRAAPGADPAATAGQRLTAGAAAAGAGPGTSGGAVVDEGGASGGSRVTMAHLLRALKLARPSLPVHERRRLEAVYAQFRQAREAGASKGGQGPKRATLA